MKKKILVVDDNESVRESLVVWFELNGFDVSKAVDGLEAIENYQKINPDAVIMDYEMPNLNGVEATKQILNNYPDAKIIGFSGSLKEDEFKEAGAVVYFEKPCDPNKITETLEALL